MESILQMQVSADLGEAVSVELERSPVAKGWQINGEPKMERALDCNGTV